MGIVECDAAGRISTANPRLTDILGGRIDLATAPHWSTLVHPDDLPRLGADPELADLGDAEALGPLRVRRADGRRRWVVVQASALPGAGRGRHGPGAGGWVGSLADVTDLVLAQESLAAREHDYRLMAENATDIITRSDGGGRLLYVSPSVGPILGYAPADLVGRRVNDIADAASFAQVLAALAALGPDEQPRPQVFRARAADGRWRWLEATMHLTRDAAGRVAQVQGHSRDVTERVEAAAALQRSRDALRASEGRFRSVAASSPVGIFASEAGHGVTYVNRRLCEIFGVDQDHARGRAAAQLVHPDDRAALRRRVLAATAAGIGFAVEFRVVRPDGAVRTVACQALPVEGSAPGTYVGSLDDVTGQVEARAASARLTAILEATPDIVGTTGPDGRVRYLNEAGRRLFGVGSHQRLEGIAARDLFTPPSRRRLADAGALARRDGAWSGELEILARDGDAIPVSMVLVAHQDAHGEVAYFSSIVRDIRERVAFEEQLRHQALHDALTGLPNRQLFLERIAEALAVATSSEHVAVLFCDLDRFKVVNDSIGHEAGDELLRAVAARLRGAVPRATVAARFGGDEFSVLCTGLAGPHEASWYAARLAAAIAEPIVVGDYEVVLSTSIGIVVAGEDDDPPSLMRNADIAMHRAKERGRARSELFDDDMRAWAQRRLATETDLRRAVDRDELRLLYQPVVDLGSGAVQGFEALLRWQHPERGLLGPADFIDVAEETGLIVPIGTWVLREACTVAAAWAVDGVGPLIAVNLSARQLVNRELPEVVAAILTETGLRPERLSLEITESVLVSDETASDSALRAFRALGVRLAIDDFGTGHSSLTRLRRYPVNTIKLDRSFVSGLGRDHGDMAIVAAVVRLARALGLDTIAEGAETDDQLRYLTGLGCDAAQGFYFSAPLPLVAAQRLLGSRWTWDVDPLTRATALAEQAPGSPPAAG